MNRDQDRNKCVYLSNRMLELLGILETGSKFNFRWLKILFWFFHGIAKYIVLVNNREKIKILRDLVNNEKISGGKLENESEIVSNFDHIGLVFSKSILYVMIAANTGMSLHTLPDVALRNGRQLPYDAAYPFDTNSTSVFAVIFIQQQLGAIFYTMMCVIFDVWLAFLTHHACGNFALLQYRLEHITKINEIGNPDKPVDIEARIARCVKLHQNIYNLTDDIEDHYHIPVLIHVIGSSLAICSSGYAITMGVEDPEMVVKHFCSAVGQIAQLFIVNWCGQQIENQSLGVSEAVYRSKFDILEARHQRDLALILLRSQRPTYITAGKFTNLSLYTFASIMKACMSYFTMLTSVEQKS